MFIKKLAIYESHPTIKLIREITFKEGVNFIVDIKNEKGQRGNGVGKTTALKLIDICLGAQDRKYIYTDAELKIENLELKDYISNSRIYSELTVCEDLLDTDINCDVLRVDLYPNGRRYVNDKQYPLKEYHHQLNSIFFNNNSDKPSFRELIGMFVRVDQKSDNDKFLRYLSDYTANTEYENVYNYLFRLSDEAVSQSVRVLKERMKALTKDRKKILKINGISSINLVEQKIIEIDKAITGMRKKIDILIDAESMKANEQSISEAKNKYLEITNQIDKYNFRQQRVRNIISNSKRDSLKKIDRSVLQNLYDETKGYFVELNKTFDQLVKFNEQILINKIAYFNNQLKEITNKLTLLEEKREGLFEYYKDVVVLIKDNNIAQYAQLQNELEETLKEKGGLENILETHTRLTKAVDMAEEELGKMTKDGVDPAANISLYNDCFTAYTQLINHESYLLYLTDEDFPIGISNVKSGFSTGTKKSVIAAFDLAYQSYVQKQDISTPRFVIHDVIETMDEVGLFNTVEIANKIKCQYIAAVLNDKLTGVENITETDKRLLLADDRKLFII